jgi:hypothetical protein
MERQPRLRPRQLLALWDEGDDDGLSAACAGSGCSSCRAELDDGGPDRGRRPKCYAKGRATALGPRHRP